MNENNETVEVAFKQKIIRLHFEEVQTDIDVDELTRIDYTNLFAEIITIPVLMNRVGLIRAEAENAYDSGKLDCAIFEAKRAEHYRKTKKRVDGDKVKWATISEIENCVTLDEGVVKYRKRVIRLRKETAFIDSLYWAVKSKEMKLNKLLESMSIKPEDFEDQITEGRINGVMVKVHKKLIPDHN